MKLIVIFLLCSLTLATPQKKPSLIEDLQANDMRMFYTHLRTADPNEVDADGNTPLMIAILKGNDKAIKDLLATKYDEGGTFSPSRGVNLNAQNKNGQTALMLAAAIPETATALLKHGADLKLADKTGKTAIQYATEAK